MRRVRGSSVGVCAALVVAACGCGDAPTRAEAVDETELAGPEGRGGRDGSSEPALDAHATLARATQHVGDPTRAEVPRAGDDASARVESAADRRASQPGSIALESAPDGVIAGRVVDGLGIARDVRLVLAPVAGSIAERVAAQRRLPDLALDRGRFRFEGVPAGQYELRACDELYCAPPVVIASDGKGLAGIVLDVKAGLRVQVELGARGVVQVRDERGRSWHEREHDGTALFALLPGAYRIEARTEAGAEYALDFVVRTKPVRIDFRP